MKLLSFHFIPFYSKKVYILNKLMWQLLVTFVYVHSVFSKLNKSVFLIQETCLDTEVAKPMNLILSYYCVKTIYCIWIKR